MSDTATLATAPGEIDDAYERALEAALQAEPDVLLLGELRNPDTGSSGE